MVHFSFVHLNLTHFIFVQLLLVRSGTSFISCIYHAVTWIVFHILCKLLSVQKMFATSPYTDTVITPKLVVEPLETGDGLIWVVGPVLAVVFIICIVIAILLYKK